MWQIKICPQIRECMSPDLYIFVCLALVPMHICVKYEVSMITGRKHRGKTNVCHLKICRIYLTFHVHLRMFKT